MTRNKSIMVGACAALVFSAMASATLAADVSQDSIDACIDAVRTEAGGGGGHILSTEFSEANSLVMLQDRNDTVWKCVVSNDGSSAFIEVAGAPSYHVPAQNDFADGMQGGPDYWRINVHSTLNVHSAPSASSPTVARLHRGMVVENRGCQFNEGRKWCQIADGDSTGWAAGEYLVEAGGPAPVIDHASGPEGKTLSCGV